MSNDKYRECIEACNACAVACSYCSTACLQEDDVKMLTRCIQLDQDCADICQLAAKSMARGSEFSDRIFLICAEICEACGEECRQHKNMEHCQECADACFECADMCREMISMKVPA
ncbi:four-helix bundle copper-binding protein [Rhodohalobacter sp. SW132]|uniref:four-helix bundle copper-binding protein n=1 Tax=Rhodohalobacter sp. SW132 TaxID=2293433 RepID=UPI000E2288A5|nr:four-helix bundle copper-binding protein [Rhodohalobacter sp. SW132]